MNRSQCSYEMSSTRRQISSKETEAAGIEEKIKRLEMAYEKINGIKKEIFDLRLEIKSKGDQEETWKGEEHEWFRSFMVDYLEANYVTYYNNLDEYHDAVMQELTYLRNTLNETRGLIGWLNSRLNDLASWWNQLTN